jgi:large subunit ribosomal protein L18
MNRTLRERRKRRIRGKISGTPERPRLTVFRSTKHIYAQVVDDIEGRVIASASTLTKGLLNGDKVDKTGAAEAVGKGIAEACKAKGIDRVVFDRNGFIYHGRVRALADAAREGGLNF